MFASRRKALSLGASVVIVIAVIIIVGFGMFLTTDLNTTTTSTGSFSSSTGSSSIETSQTGTTITGPATEQSLSTSPNGLRLGLFIGPSNGSLGTEVISVDEYNTLNFTNNVTLASEWGYPESSLNPFAPCIPTEAVGVAVFQGYYDLSNFTRASALTLFNSSRIFSCTVTDWVPGTYYSFKPQSDQASLHSPGETSQSASTAISLSAGAKGYWTGGLATGMSPAFRIFPQGVYTVIAADEWGKVVLVHFTVTSNGISSGTSTYTTGVVSSYTTSQGTVATTSPEPNWDYGQVANIIKNSTKVQSYIKDAYSYMVSIYPDHFDPAELITVIIDVNGSQSVVGNYTTGYTITYSGIKVLNATVQFNPPENYTIAALGVTSIPNQSQSVTFSSQEQRVIQVALSNSTVEELMGATTHYYVEYINQFPLQNGTFAGDYFVFMFQVNGSRTVSAFVNPQTNAVVNAYVGNRVYTMCFGSSNVCFTSPWNATG